METTQESIEITSRWARVVEAAKAAGHFLVGPEWHAHYAEHNPHHLNDEQLLHVA